MLLQCDTKRLVEATRPLCLPLSFAIPCIMMCEWFYADSHRLAYQLVSHVLWWRIMIFQGCWRNSPCPCFAVIKRDFWWQLLCTRMAVFLVHGLSEGCLADFYWFDVPHTRRTFKGSEQRRVHNSRCIWRFSKQSFYHHAPCSKM